MTEVDRERLARARVHPEFERAQHTEPNTWITISTVVTLVMLVSIIAVVAWYPWEQRERLPEGVRMIQNISWLPTIAAAIIVSILFVSSLALAVQPTRRVLAMVAPRAYMPGPQMLRLVQQDGTEADHVCRRNAASAVRVGTIAPGEIGVALMKGDAVLQWIPIPV